MNEEIEKIAIIGMSGAFPGARNIGELWDLLCSKRDGISTLSREELLASGESASLMDDPAYVPRGGFLEDAEYFDNAFFSVSPSEALAMDPQQRLFLSHARLALEDSGYLPERLEIPVGVFAGESPTQYWFLLRNGPYTRSLEDFRLMLGNEKDYIATRTSYKLNLKGPSLDVQSACSTSLAAVGLACQSLLTWNCDMALAGGASVSAPRKRGYTAYEGMIVSPTGACRPFDEKADGTLFGEGVGVVCLKRLSEALGDGDYIYAVIDAVAMNNDGSDKVGFTAPSVNGQAAVIELAQAMAEVSPSEIGFVETHGTATGLGDPIEFQALSQAFRKGTQESRFCRLGSIKANIGHLDAAAGIASLIKTALVLNTGIIPPMLHYEKPNPHLDLETSPFLINRDPVEWPLRNGRRVAGLSSFGIGGTNVHAILESPPVRPVVPSQAVPLFLSAKTPEGLQAYATRVAEYLVANPSQSTEALAGKILRTRVDYPWRRGFLTQDRGSLLEELTQILEPGSPATKGKTLFAFPGQGSQFSAMAKAYHGTLPVFTEWVDRGLELVQALGCADIAKFLMEDGFENEIARTENTQPLLYIMEYALARELMAAGARPAALVGHSIGEYAAATIGGALDFEDGLSLVRQRGYWMQRAPAGAMLALPLSGEDALRFTGADLFLSVRNTASQTVISGSIDAVDGLERTLLTEGIKYTRLKTSHAFHSPLMDEILEPFAAEVRKIRFKRLELPMLSNIDGGWLNGEVDWNSYWVRQLRQPVHFDACIATLGSMQDMRVIETGPGRTLTAFIKSSFPDREDVFPILPNAKTVAGFYQKSLIRFWERGIEVVLPLPAPRGADLILFPGYPYERRQFWPKTQLSDPVLPTFGLLEVDDDASVPITIREAQGSHGRVRQLWINILGHENFDDDTNFFLCGADSFAGIQLIKKLKDELGLELQMADLMRAPTICGIASFLQAEPVEKKALGSRFLFAVQTRGNSPALFMVAGAHGNRYFDPETLKNSYEEDFFRYFSRLIATLGEDQPLYGFRPRGLVMAEPQHTDVSTMARTYIQAMKEVQAEGPYYIGGECVGGIVALEMACILEERGEKVERLFLLDTPRPSLWVAFREDVLHKKRLLRESIKTNMILLLKHGPIQLARSFHAAFPVIFAKYLPVTKILRLQRRGLNGSAHYQWTLLSHTPRSFAGKVTYVINRTWNRGRYLMGWKREICSQLEVYEVPGHHGNRLVHSGWLIGKIIRNGISRRN